MSTLIIDDVVNSGLRASVKFDRWDGERAQYEWRIEITAAPDEMLCDVSRADLRLGSCKEPSDAEALATLLDFLGAFCESVQYERRTGTDGSNSDLFPAELKPWAEATDADAIAMLRRELGAGSTGLLDN